MDQSLPPLDAVDLARVARLVRPFETLETRAAPRPGGGWAIGYGHVRSARAGAQVTRDEAEALLLYDLRHIAEVVRSAIYAPAHRNQLEALVAFAFHIGTERFLTSTTLHRFNAGDSLGAALELERWRCGDFEGEVQVIDALVRRRAAEKAHFLTPPEGFPKASRARLPPQFEAAAPGLGDPPNAAPSAALAAAHSVSARLRALVPDPAPHSAPDPMPDTADPAELRPATFESTPSPELAPVVLKAVVPPEPEIPPPPMPFEVAASPATPWPEKSGPEKSGPATLRPDADDTWPSYTPLDVGASDPFAQGPLDAAAIEAPAPEDLTLIWSATSSSLFRAKPEHRLESPARPEQTRKASSQRASSSKVLGPRASWSAIPRAWLLAAFALGAAVFVWSIWSIFKTAPSPVNFIAGLVGVALMAGPAYLLLGPRDR